METPSSLFYLQPSVTFSIYSVYSCETPLGWAGGGHPERTAAPTAPGCLGQAGTQSKAQGGSSKIPPGPGSEKGSGQPAKEAVSTNEQPLGQMSQAGAQSAGRAPSSLAQGLSWGERSASSASPPRCQVPEPPSPRKEKREKGTVASSVSPLEKSLGFLEGMGLGLLYHFIAFSTPRNTSARELTSTIASTASACCLPRDIGNLSSDLLGPLLQAEVASSRACLDHAGILKAMRQQSLAGTAANRTTAFLVGQPLLQPMGATRVHSRPGAARASSVS